MPSLVRCQSMTKDVRAASFFAAVARRFASPAVCCAACLGERSTNTTADPVSATRDPKSVSLPLRPTSGVTGAIKSHSFIIALNINKLSFSAQRWKSLVMRHMTKNCELDSKSEYLTPFSHSDHHHGSRGPLHESRKLSTIGPTESTFASADSRSDSLNM